MWYDNNVSTRDKEKERDRRNETNDLLDKMNTKDKLRHYLETDIKILKKERTILRARLNHLNEQIKDDEERLKEVI